MAKENSKKKKIVSILAFIIIVAIWLLIAYFLGRKVLQYISEPAEFRKWVQGYGFFGWVICILIAAMQIVMPGIPSTPIAVGAGYTYGIFVGTILYMIGFTIGAFLVFNIVRKFGQKLLEYFFPIDKIKSLKFLHDSHKRNGILFFIFLLPGTPKSLIIYFMGLTDIDIKLWVWIAVIARTPSIFIYSVGGNAVGKESYIQALIVLILFAIATLGGAFVYKNILAIVHRKKELNAERKNK